MSVSRAATVRKLLRLARSGSTHEARAAAGRAQAIMEKYDLSEADVEDSDDQADECVRVDRYWLELAVTTIAEHFGCTVYVEGTDPDVLVIRGPRLAAERARLSFNEVAEAAKHYCGSSWTTFFERLPASVRRELDPRRLGHDTLLRAVWVRFFLNTFAESLHFTMRSVAAPPDDPNAPDEDLVDVASETKTVRKDKKPNASRGLAEAEDALAEMQAATDEMVRVFFIARYVAADSVEQLSRASGAAGVAHAKQISLERKSRKRLGGRVSGV